jgi:hypothetical protein
MGTKHFYGDPDYARRYRKVLMALKVIDWDRYDPQAEPMSNNEFISLLEDRSIGTLTLSGLPAEMSEIA